MKKQVGKTKLFTKETLTTIQDKMRIACIKSFNKVYNNDMRLKEKQKGRNQDINVKDMAGYKAIKNNYEKFNLKLKKANEKTNNVYTSSNKVKKMLENLKPTLMNKNNSLISKEKVEEIINLIDEVQDTTQSVNSVNSLNIMMNDIEYNYNNLDKEIRSLKYEIELKDKEIGRLNKELSSKEKIIGKLRMEIDKVKIELSKFKGFWYSLMKRFHNKICFDNDEHYKMVSDDLYKNGIFTDDENEIANNQFRKVKPREKTKPKEQEKPWSVNRKKNDINLN